MAAGKDAAGSDPARNDPAGSDPVADVCGSYQIVGVRVDGTRVVISHHESSGVADRAVRLIQRGSSYSELVVEKLSGQSK